MTAAVHELMATSDAVHHLIQDIAMTVVVCLGLSTLTDRVLYGR